MDYIKQDITRGFMANSSNAPQPKVVIQSLNALKLEDFGNLQKKYQSMSLPQRAQTVLSDSDLALRTADRILSQLSSNPRIDEVFERIRRNSTVMGKMRPSEAKNILIDTTADFIDVARHKLAVWRKTMERISQGEGILYDHHRKEYISSHVPLALAISSASMACVYLSVIQLVYHELEKLDSKNEQHYKQEAAKIRRCSTFLSDCENAACFREIVH